MLPEPVQEEAKDDPTGTVGAAHHAEQKAGVVDVHPVLDGVVRHEGEVGEDAEVDEQVGEEQEDHGRGGEKFFVGFPSRLFLLILVFHLLQSNRGLVKKASRYGERDQDSQAVEAGAKAKACQDQLKEWCEDQLTEARPTGCESKGQTKASAEVELKDVDGRETEKAEAKTREDPDGDVEHGDLVATQQVDVETG